MKSCLPEPGASLLKSSLSFQISCALASLFYNDTFCMIALRCSYAKFSRTHDVISIFCHSTCFLSRKCCYLNLACRVAEHTVADNVWGRATLKRAWHDLSVSRMESHDLISSNAHAGDWEVPSWETS
jgi:hypothetical protein